MAGRILIGTSGFSYKEWSGVFYPDKLPASKMLEYYAERLETTEINYTFRAMPRRLMLERWASQTPEGFRFALKAPQRITHYARLRGTRDLVQQFTEVTASLGSRLGPTLFQLPPDLGRDDELLRRFLSEIGPLQVALEFRNRSWFDDVILSILREAKVALCIAESDKISTPLERTASFAYVRLRRQNYDDGELAVWASRLSRLASEAKEIYVYFKHETNAPRLAWRLREMLAS